MQEAAHLQRDCYNGGQQGLWLLSTRPTVMPSLQQEENGAEKRLVLTGKTNQRDAGYCAELMTGPSMLTGAQGYLYRKPGTLTIRIARYWTARFGNPWVQDRLVPIVL